MKKKNIQGLSGNVLFVGDIHGDLDATISAFNLADDRGSKIVFLGDVIDRGSRQLECANLLLSNALLHPDKVHYIRANHEFTGVNSMFGFIDAVLKKYDKITYLQYNSWFATLPLAALLNGRTFAIHGGVCSRVPTLKSLESIDRTSLRYMDERMGILWNDPSESGEGFMANNQRGVFFTFGRDVFDEFMDRNNLELMIRAHEPWPDGHKYFFDKRLISVFSSADHYKDVKPKAILVEADGSHEVLSL
jgi:diadenosine tetraphosphatase ApaH/serine/threonine PP2A family protein phosphatase